MTRFTVFGGTGFIGRHLVAALQSAGHDVVTPVRGDAVDANVGYGHIIYAIGLTGDYRQRPHDTVEAHVGLASRILQTAHFDSFLYLSSTRVYRGLPADTLATEDTALPQVPSLDGVYDYSKLLGESLCLAHENPAVRVARLSNVYGKGMSPALFLGSILAALKENGRVTIQDHADSAKDYISIDDAVDALAAIAQNGHHRIYNVASGRRLGNRALADALTAAGQTVDFAHGGTPRIFAQIDTRRLTAEFGGARRVLTDDIATLLT